MAIEHVKDIENGDYNKGVGDLEQPFLEWREGSSGSLGVVLFSTFVAVCGSFEFGSCVSDLCVLFYFDDVCLVLFF